MSDFSWDGDVVAALRDALGDDCVSTGDAIGARHSTNYGEAPGARPRALLRPRSDAELAAMRTLKHAFDPLGLLNPGKVF
ncbi:FAD-linked oxidase C-terminal domain-containing protein [Burkholderia pyrrocinia]|uniref:FAD-linked oxidase C-terminal domain-containing protein n=1 Tax=Burkholderia pyrrocinia TaxID=60550 RepID=A0ABZ3BY15_BURPY